jgi:hypothetical protein
LQSLTWRFGAARAGDVIPAVINSALTYMSINQLPDFIATLLDTRSRK